MSAMPKLFDGGRSRGIVAIIALALGQAVSTGIAAFATRDVFAAFRDNASGLPILALTLVAGSGLAIAAMRYRERVIAERVGQGYVAALRVRLFQHLAQVSARDIAHRRSGALSLRFVGDLSAVRNWVSLGLTRLISSLIVLPVATIALFLLNPHLGVAAAVPIATGMAAMALAGPRLGPAHKKLRSRRARLAADMSERVPHAPELRLLGRVKTETRLIIKRTENLIDAALERARGAALLRAIPDAVSGVAAAMVFVAALASGAAAAEAAGALAAVGLMIQPLRDLAGVWDRHRAWKVARDKCEKLLSVPKLAGGDDGDDAELDNVPQSLSFDGAGAGCLSSVDVVAEPGRKIAIVGPNGAGKSTLLSLAAGLESPERGEVLLGDRRTVELSTSERRRLIAYVGTRSPILAGSLRRALTMGVDGALDDETIAHCAERFGLGPVIKRLGGLSGKVSEAGRNLSAGEIRRVLLTRAALSGSSLLLLDEPDDALDQEGPALVERLVDETPATTLMITHNRDLAARMDEVWIIDDGELVAKGPPDAVLRACGGASASGCARAV
ncbi:MAG: ABC transporter ATP-binding protein [Roseitalea sp.]|jgi:ABC-type multidrug transport system fused ATPase/permease subunit|nr:ABC transporter ATP-binding protein [Roseitalea sp.]MBO6720417.1 ABC transporter ATP-binding protein [Roseitalea sp.]MBO6742777.1 ABC transporter ATP-binding protein [Roseitalea sp.]